MECKGLEIRPIRGGYMLTNQRRVYVDQSERRSSKLDQSEPSSQNAMRDTPDCIKGTVSSICTSDVPPQFRKGCCGIYDFTAHIFLILSLTCTPKSVTGR